ncbi:hypothetical protein PUN28_006105 [Cardiocondyla obscurior]|uniref:Uncharacterized protein n=1 Tax=Cardiocondyla obscurior TaxID=286306 RepID=A0AAW2GAX1_9HYME
MNILLYYKFYIAFILFLLCIKIINNEKSYYNSYVTFLLQNPQRRTKQYWYKTNCFVNFKNFV